MRPSPIDGLDARTPVDEAARRSLAARLLDLRHNVDGLLRERTPDSVHDTRVAARRLRAALELFAGRALSGAVDAVRNFGKALGAVRDLDVQLEWLAEAARGVSPAERVGIAALADERRRELPPLETALGHELRRFSAEVLPPLDAALAHIGGRGTLAGRRMRRALRRRLRGLQARADAALPAPDAHRAHRLRIAVKKTRYLGELLVPALPDPVGALLGELTPLQELLGDLHDRDVRLPLVEAFLVRASAEQQPGGVALLRQALGERERLAAELSVDLRRWHADRVARALRRALK
jgi:CHAD domain-containing protein